MSDDPKPLDLSELSGQSLAPAWVTEIGKGGSEQTSDYKEFEERPGRGNRDGRRGGGGGRRDDRRGGGGGGRRQDDNRGRGRGDGQRRDDRRGGGPGGGGPGGGRGHQDRRDGRDGRGGGRGRDDRRGGKGGRGRDSRFGDRPQHQEEKPPEGISVEVQPVPSGLDSLAAWIRSAGRATSIYELAKAMLRRRELYQLRFRRTAENAPKLVQCVADGTLWTSREAAVGHWIHAGAPGDFYAQETVEVDPPKGNFTSIAICGMSGTLLGPPNHHTYQTNLHRLHRERFSNMPIDRYKSRIDIEHGEEIVEKWRTQNSKTTQYRWLKDPSLTKPEPAPAPESPEAAHESSEDLESGGPTPLSGPPTDPEAPEPATPESIPETSEASETPAPEATDAEPAATENEAEESAPSEESASEAETQDETPAAKPEGLYLESTDDLRRHALTHHADELFTEVESATVSGNISGRDIGAPLLTALKVALDPLRRFPAPLVPGLCKELEGRGLKIFRWGRALFANGNRPRPLAEDANLSDGISKIVALVREHPGIGTKRILRTLVEKPTPKTPSDEATAEPPAQPPSVQPPETPTAETTPAIGTPTPDTPSDEASAESPAQPPSAQPSAPPTAETTPATETPTPVTPSDEASAESPAQPPSDQPPETPPATENPTPETPSDEARVELPNQPQSDQPPASQPDQPTSDEKPPAPEPSPEEHAAQVAILRDLRWLVHEGYLIEFTDGKIFLATARPPAHPAKKKQAPKKKRAPRQRRRGPKNSEHPKAEEIPQPKEPAKPEPAEAPKPEVSPDAPTEKIIRDTGTPSTQTERVPIPPPTTEHPSAEKPDPDPDPDLDPDPKSEPEPEPQSESTPSPEPADLPPKIEDKDRSE